MGGRLAAARWAGGGKPQLLGRGLWAGRASWKQGSLAKWQDPLVRKTWALWHQSPLSSLSFPAFPSNWEGQLVTMSRRNLSLVVSAPPKRSMSYHCHCERMTGEYLDIWTLCTLSDCEGEMESEVLRSTLAARAVFPKTTECSPWRITWKQFSDIWQNYSSQTPQSARSAHS